MDFSISIIQGFKKRIIAIFLHWTQVGSQKLYEDGFFFIKLENHICYSHIWLDLPMVDSHFGYIKELTKKNHWTGYELVLNMTPTTEPETVAEVIANISLYHLFSG